VRSFVVIPAFNEQRQIAEVIEAAQDADAALIATEHVVVVDNNCTDATAEIARSMGAHVLECGEQGKGWAMLEGATYALQLGAFALTFLDADLRGITPVHINKLAEPVVEEEALMTIGYLGGRKSYAKRILNRWGGFSGQRTVAPVIWDQLEAADFEGWRIEGALNAVFRNHGIGNEITRLELEGLRHIGKREKEPTLLRAGRRYFETYGSAFRGLLSASGRKAA
jgi:glycosyltransferase involved in cell wall biosynthesis